MVPSPADEAPSSPQGAIHRPALRYYGAKWRIAPWIIRHFPDHACYVEPFCGGASCLFQKAPSGFEVINDLDGNVVNFFRVLREDADRLRRAINRTPFSRQETVQASKPCKDPLERARRFYIRAWQTQHGAPYMGRNGWRFGRRGGNDKRSAVDDWNDTERLPAIAQRLKNVQIEHDDAMAIIRRFDSPTTLFYCDPPYVGATRTSRWRDGGYTHEMTDAQHRALAELLSGIKGLALVSGYPGELYAELYRAWILRTRTGWAGHSTEPRVEGLWLSPRTARAFGQRDLFEGPHE